MTTSTDTAKTRSRPLVARRPSARATAAVSVLVWSGLACGRPSPPAAPKPNASGEGNAHRQAAPALTALPPPLDDAPTKAEIVELLAQLDSALDRREPNAFWQLWEPVAMRRGDRGVEFAKWLEQPKTWVRQSKLLEYRIQREFGIALVESSLHRVRAASARSSEPRRQWVVARRYRLKERSEPTARVHLLVDHNTRLYDMAVHDGRYQCRACNFRFGAALDSWLLAVGYQQKSDCVGNVNFFALGEDLVVSLSVMALANSTGTAESNLRQLLTRQLPNQPNGEDRWTAPVPFTVPGRPGTSARASENLAQRVHDVEFTTHGSMGYLISVAGDRGAAGRFAEQIEALRESFAFVDRSKDPARTRSDAMTAYSKGGVLTAAGFAHAELGIEFGAPSGFEPTLQTGQRLFCVKFEREVDGRIERILVSGLRAPPHEPARQRVWLDRRITEGLPEDRYEHTAGEWQTSPSTMLSMPIAKRTVLCQPTGAAAAAPDRSTRAGDSACFVHTRLYGDDLAVVVEAQRGGNKEAPRPEEWPALAKLLESIQRPD